MEAGKNLAAIGHALVELASDLEGGSLIKAQKYQIASPDEGQDRTPGGKAEDTPEAGPVPTEPSGSEPKSVFWDPYAVLQQIGFKEKFTQISYGTIRSALYRMPIFRVIIQLRQGQVASFAQPQADRYQIGFRVKIRDRKRSPTKVERVWCQQAESMLMRTGVTENPRGRDDFGSFLKKLIFDTMAYDQMTFEVVPDRLGRPCEWYHTDATTMRLADSSKLTIHAEDPDQVSYVQVYDGQVINEYTAQELCFGVRNPRTDLRGAGYGESELEMVLRVVTALIYGWDYNQNAFSQGSIQKGMLNFKGAIPAKQMQSLRRHWYMMLSGVQNAWKTPIVNSDDVQWINMMNTNRDMEYNAWIDFLIKIGCSIYSTDPSEINFQYGNSGQKSSLGGESNREKIIESKERGLRPLLTFTASKLNRHIIWPINEDFEFEFVGLDAATRENVASLNQTRVKSTHTVNELRAEEDLPPLEHGDVILDPTYVQYVAQQTQPDPGEMPGAGGEPGDGKGDEEEDDVDFEQLLAEDNDDGDEDEDQSEPPANKREEERTDKSLTVDVSF